MLRKLSAAVLFLLSVSNTGGAQTLGDTDYRQIGAPLAPVRIVTETGTVFTEADAVPGENLFIMLFNPTCDHCQEAARLLGKVECVFKPGQIYLMATANMLPHLEFFQSTTRYKNFPTLRVGVDSSGFIERTFNYQGLPELLIYDRNRRLAATMSGSLSVDTLLSYMGPDARQYKGPALSAPASAPNSGPFRVTTPADEPRKRKRKNQ